MVATGQTLAVLEAMKCTMRLWLKRPESCERSMRKPAHGRRGRCPGRNRRGGGALDAQPPIRKEKNTHELEAIGAIEIFVGQNLNVHCLSTVWLLLECAKDRKNQQQLDRRAFLDGRPNGRSIESGSQIIC